MGVANSSITEDPVIQNEQLSALYENVTMNFSAENFRGPGVVAKKKKAWGLKASIVVTPHRLLVHCTKNTKGVPLGRLISCPFTDDRFDLISIGTRDDKLVLSVSDLGRFSEDWAGSFELALAVPTPEKIGSIIQESKLFALQCGSTGRRTSMLAEFN
eukprot:TRINITY_DN52071_c0_g1_i1.p2 TRINITY_DN52071_c0_g1~~TRINITY_DN52071_c0_g1_i1.p2  ORF type:complete len:158 (+),score=20.64 TRINITY_DN52071_c0_g1_i1:108-581(+)